MPKHFDFNVIDKLILFDSSKELLSSFSNLHYESTDRQYKISLVLNMDKVLNTGTYVAMFMKMELLIIKQNINT